VQVLHLHSINKRLTAHRRKDACTSLMMREGVCHCDEGEMDPVNSPIESGGASLTVSRLSAHG
jgi:hypothetical protein